VPVPIRVGEVVLVRTREAEEMLVRTREVAGTHLAAVWGPALDRERLTLRLALGEHSCRHTRWVEDRKRAGT